MIVPELNPDHLSLLDVWVSTAEDYTAADAEAAFRAFAGSGLPSGPDQPLTVFLDYSSDHTGFVGRYGQP